MKRLFTLAASTSLIALFCATAARAEDGPFTKADVEALAATKNMNFIRMSDQKEQDIQLKDGYAFRSINAGTRPVNVSGTYEITDNAKLCIKWRNTDRYVTLQDTCFTFRREGDKVVLGVGNDPTSHFGELIK
jgi:hypothetical protein